MSGYEMTFIYNRDMNNFTRMFDVFSVYCRCS